MAFNLCNKYRFQILKDGEPLGPSSVMTGYAVLTQVETLSAIYPDNSISIRVITRCKKPRVIRPDDYTCIGDNQNDLMNKLTYHNNG